MDRTFTPLALALTFAALFAPTALAADDDSRGSAEPGVDSVYVDMATVRFVDEGSGPAELVISGSLPTPCHEPVWEVTNAPDAVRVWLWSWPGEGPCAAVLEPVELTIPLGELEAGTPVLLEGQPVDWSSAGPAADPVRLTGAGWSFGMCLGYCAADLRFDGDSVVMRGHDRDRSEPLFVNEGRLREGVSSRIEAAVSALDVAQLQEVYGCPDCADGGAAYVQLQTGAEESRHAMEFGAPPPELTEVYDLAMALSEALETCSSTELVWIADDCVGYERSST